MIRYYSVPKETFVTNGTIVEPLNVTENGTYAPPAGTAYSPVVVNVEGGGGSWQTVFEGSVETVDDDGDIFGVIENLTLSGDSIKVTFNGTVYELPKTEHGYGAENESGIDFSTYPLFIATGGDTDSCALWTQTAGTYTLKIEEQQSGGGSDFSTAEVQLTIPAGVTNVTVYGAFCVDYEEISATDFMANETETHTAILYKGKGLISILMGAGRSATVSGNIENIGSNDYFITGDCTITIS